MIVSTTFRKKKQAVEYIPVLPDLSEEQPCEELAMRQERLFTALKKLDDGDKAIIIFYLGRFKLSTDS